MLFHYHHAKRREEEKTKNLNELIELGMAIVNPEMYKKYTDNKKTEISTALDDKDISENEFNKIKELADARMAQIQSQTQDQKKAPPKYGERPAGVPEMKMGTDISANPITLE